MYHIVVVVTDQLEKVVSLGWYSFQSFRQARTFYKATARVCAIGSGCVDPSWPHAQYHNFEWTTTDLWFDGQLPNLAGDIDTQSLAA
jgi:hypothetical protein